MSRAKGAVVLGSTAGVIALLLAFRKKAKAAPEFWFTCVFGDGFRAQTWAEMQEHYCDTHPGSVFAPAEVCEPGVPAPEPECPPAIPPCGWYCPP